MVRPVRVARSYQITRTLQSTISYWKPLICTAYDHNYHVHVAHSLKCYRVVAENETYCHLSVQFLIRVHGMGMGAITTVMTLLVSRRKSI